ncbi:ArsR/SmtB family transcription factor [Paenibacillus thermotolerans]|uniref:ArsR/SmtB family transcription factor n=1 Tax=Paenibacillus thermotolerans TaxID=3027807 RepID=UPI0023676087|nr:MULTISPECIES: helix-turn-helix domain-containing protein [unclassified Paenibacillus]
MKIEVNAANAGLLSVFGSETRIRMLEWLSQGPMNIREMAERLELSSAIVTKHVQQLEAAGLIVSESIPGKRGVQKRCILAVDSVTLEFKPEPAAVSRHTVSVPIGHYTDYDVRPTCGLASAAKMIGMNDDPRYFADPEHIDACHLWFGEGFVEYTIPNYTLANQQIEAIDLSLEICSEAPGFNEHWPSDIAFDLGGVRLGVWTCPGDFGSTRGNLTPAWWSLGTEYGLLKTITVDQAGSWVDGVRLSDVTIEQLRLPIGKPMRFRITALPTPGGGGVSLFGRGFGNYDQDIVASIRYK